MSSCIDHLIITAPSLESGAAFVCRTLGVVPQIGGKHPRMGTHNLLLRLGEGVFLEVIAVDPAAPVPGRPRWFGLDRLGSDAPPMLAGWVARTDRIWATAAAASDDLGIVEPMSRGALNWHITLPADGKLPLQGAGPALIEWQTPAHPAAMLDDLGLSLAGLDIFHPQQERILRLLHTIDFDGPLAVWPLAASARPYLVARINTPHGLCELRSGPSTSAPFSSPH